MYIHLKKLHRALLVTFIKFKFEIFLIKQIQYTFKSITKLKKAFVFQFFYVKFQNILNFQGLNHFKLEFKKLYW